MKFLLMEHKKNCNYLFDNCSYKAENREDDNPNGFCLLFIKSFLIVQHYWHHQHSNGFTIV
jgi:hypothetical protein